MEEYNLMENSISKNIQELSEFLVDNFNITNYYDLVDYIVDLHNFRAKTFKENKKLAKKIMNQLRSEEE